MPMQKVMIKVEIFDPPMCCPTGMCGPTIDPVLIEIHETLCRIKDEYDGLAEVTRHLFGSDTKSFLSNPGVLSLIREKGPDVLPITTINGEIIKSGSYPSYQEIKNLLDKIQGS